MSQCVTVDGAGYVVATTETFPQCADLAIVDPSHLERLTFWADVSMQLEPTNSDSWAFYTAVLLTFIVAFGVRQVARLILNR